MTAAYKYCDPVGYEAMLGGSFRLRRLSFYRKQEAGGVRDPLDGRSEVRITRTFGPGDRVGVEGWPDNISLISVEGKDTVVRWGGGPMAAEISPLVFCASLSRADRFWQNEHDARYDCLLGIFNFQRLASHISQALHNVGIMNTFGVCSIKYRESLRIRGNNIPAPDACVKSAAFSQENEIRAIFFDENEDPANASQEIDIQVGVAGLLMCLKEPK